MSNRHSMSSFPVIGTIYVNELFDRDVYNNHQLEYTYRGILSDEEDNTLFWSFSSKDGELYLPCILDISDYGLIVKV